MKNRIVLKLECGCMVAKQGGNDEYALGQCALHARAAMMLETMISAYDDLLRDKPDKAIKKMHKTLAKLNKYL